MMFSAKLADLAPIVFEEEFSLIAHRETLLWSPHLLLIGELEEDGPLDSARVAAHPLKGDAPFRVAWMQDKLPFGAANRADDLLDDLCVAGRIEFHTTRPSSRGALRQEAWSRALQVGREPS